jgi:hypothetical protein
VYRVNSLSLLTYQFTFLPSSNSINFLLSYCSRVCLGDRKLSALRKEGGSKEGRERKV